MPKPLIWEAWGLHLGTLGDHLGDPGIPGDTPQDTVGSSPGFLSTHKAYACIPSTLRCFVASAISCPLVIGGLLCFCCAPQAR